MEMFIVTPDEAKVFAEKIFLSSYPGKAMWFNVAWETILDKENIVLSGDMKEIIGLAATDTLNSEAVSMADDLAMVFEAFMIKEPVLGVELAERVRNIAEKRSTEILNKNKILRRFRFILDDLESENSHALSNLIKEQFDETNELIRAQHQKTRESVRKPVISSKFTYNCLLTINPVSREVIINSGFEEVSVKLSRVKLQLFKAIAELCMTTGGWVSWDEIAVKVPDWINAKGEINKTDNYIRHRIAELRKELPQDFSELIESRQSHGYRISTHPENISIYSR